MRLSYGAFSMSVNGEPTRISHAFVKKYMIRYMRAHGRFAHCSCENTAKNRGQGRQAVREPHFGLLCRNILFLNLLQKVICDTRTKKRTLDKKCEVGALAFSFCADSIRLRLAWPTSQPFSNGRFYALVSQVLIYHNFAEKL